MRLRHEHEREPLGLARVWGSAFRILGYPEAGVIVNRKQGGLPVPREGGTEMHLEISMNVNP